MENLLRAAQVWDANKLDVIKIHLTNITWPWWQLQENRLPQSIFRYAFSTSFLTRFFLRAAKSEMEQQFINLRQTGTIEEEYASEFVHLSRFKPYMRSNEVDCAHPF